jgi:hypothetical protein
MTRHLWALGVTSLIVAAPARADIVINAPFVSVHVGQGGGVRVCTPWATVQAPRPVVVTTPYTPPIVVPTRSARPAAPAQVPAPVESAPASKIGDPIPVPIPKPGQTDFSVPVPLPEARAMSHREFADTFKPAAGTYEVVLMHPVTNKPVNVTFTLPPGTPSKVRVLPRRIAFDYGRQTVLILFQGDGTVRVSN